MILREHPAEWEITNLPAIAIEKEPPPLSRKPGDALWPEHFDLERLREYRTVLGGAAFATLYQGNPTSAEGAIFKRQWWQSYDAASPPPFTRTIMSADTAFKATQSADFSAVTIWSEAQSGYFLRHCWKGRVDFPALQRAIELLAHEWRPNYLLVEDAASGQSLIQTLKAETKLPIKAMKVDRDKVTRASAASPLVESGRVFIPASAPWLDSFLDEVSGFPGGAPHDDIVDTVSMALNYFRDSSGGPSRVWTDTGPDSLVRRAYQWRGAF
jgi:predicted phage terminase large subunit-like protein